jgi:hypothetical protein
MSGTIGRETFMKGPNRAEHPTRSSMTAEVLALSSAAIVLLPLLAGGCSSDGGSTDAGDTARDAAPQVDAASPDDAGLRADAGRDAAFPDGGDECAPVRLEPAASDRLLLVDLSGSWSRRADRYAGATDALIASVADSAHAHALAIFPRLVEGAASCEPDAYDALDVGWPASATELSDRLAGATFAGESPLGPALEGAIATGRARAREMPDRTTSIVLVTDATPGDDEVCGTWEEVAEIARRGFGDGEPEGVHVHVISVMGTAVSDEHFARLGAIAGAGGGFAAFVNGSREEVESSTRDALDVLDARASTCSMRLPAGLLPARLSYSFASGAEVTLDRVPDASHCGDGAFYVDDESAPRIATVCSGEAGVGGACELLLVRARAEGAPEVHATECGI